MLGAAMHRLILLLILLLPALAQARLGETHEQCVARYGSPTEEIPDFAIGSMKVLGSIFQKDGLEIFAIFVDGRAIQVAYSRRPAADLPAAQIQTLLTDNAAGETWRVLSTDATPNYWETSRSYAVHDANLRQLIFTNRDYFDRLQDFKGKVPLPK